MEPEIGKARQLQSIPTFSTKYFIPTQSPKKIKNQQSKNCRITFLDYIWRFVSNKRQHLIYTWLVMHLHSSSIKTWWNWEIPSLTKLRVVVLLTKRSNRPKRKRAKTSDAGVCNTNPVTMINKSWKTRQRRGGDDGGDCGGVNHSPSQSATGDGGNHRRSTAAAAARSGGIRTPLELSPTTSWRGDDISKKSE